MDVDAPPAQKLDPTTERFRRFFRIARERKLVGRRRAEVQIQFCRLVGCSPQTARAWQFRRPIRQLYRPAVNLALDILEQKFQIP